MKALLLIGQDEPKFRGKAWMEQIMPLLSTIGFTHVDDAKNDHEKKLQQ